jgi:hypothetical protein
MPPWLVILNTRHPEDFYLLEELSRSLLPRMHR